MNRACLPLLPLALAFASSASAQIVMPTSVVETGGPTCNGSTANYNVSITLPDASTASRIDVFLLFDDTGSFANEIPQVVNVFTRVVALLQQQVPTADIAYGVGRLEDYGGPGANFGNESTLGRPFILNQAILSRGEPTFVADLQAALSNTAPGFGGDAPETSGGEALFQIATGAGFDGDGNGSRLDSGPAGAQATQTMPGTSGDVPPYSSYVGTASGVNGGIGWRQNALRIVILATDICPVAAFDPSQPIPATIDGAGGSEPVTAFQCPFGNRFGFVSDSKNPALNTVPNAVAPLGSATIPQTIAALNAAGIRVIGLAPDGAPTIEPGPSTNPSVMLSALGRLTGAVDSNGDPLIFDINGGEIQIAQSVVDGVLELASIPIDIGLEAQGLPTGLNATITPSTVPDIGPGETANFLVSLDPDPTFDGGNFALRFRDQDGGNQIGTIPFNLMCSSSCTVIDFETEDDFTTPLENGAAVASFLNFERILRIDGVSNAQWSTAIFDTDPNGPNAMSSDQDLLVGTGNALIFQENGASSSPFVYSNPDDDENGGTALFTFFRPVTMCSLDLIDLDVGEDSGATIVMIDLGGRARIYNIPAGFTEDRVNTTGSGMRTLNLQTLEPQPGFLSTATASQQSGFQANRVFRMFVFYRGSGAMDNLAFDLNTGLLRPGRPDPATKGRLPGMPAFGGMTRR